MEPQKRQGWRVKDWCAPDVKIISEALLFKLWREGNGPKHVHVGGATVITESHGEYLERLAHEAAAERPQMEVKHPLLLQYELDAFLAEIDRPAAHRWASSRVPQVAARVELTRLPVLGL